MPDQFSSSLPYILLATGAGILGSVIALFWNPNVRIRSAIQHFAAGAVLAAIAASVIPEVERIGTLRGVVQPTPSGEVVRMTAFEEHCALNRQSAQVT